MSITVKQKLVSQHKWDIKAPFEMDAEFITFHNTANDVSAEREIIYMINNNSKVSYHFAVDEKEVVQGIPLNRTAWHCGDGLGRGNLKSIGVEVCYSKSGGTKYKKAEALAIKFIAQLLHERNWGTDRVKQHNYWSGKNCPHLVRSEGRWIKVIASIQKELDALNTVAVGGKVDSVTYIPAPQTTRNYLKKGDKGTAVKNLQTLLSKAGYSVGTIDGIFGQDTLDAVLKFQKENGLAVDGIAGNGTMQVLESEQRTKDYLIKGDQGADVKDLQNLLIKAGYNLGKYGADGHYGDDTVKAVSSFQKSSGLAVDGVAGKNTIKALKNYKKPTPVKEYLTVGDKGAQVKELQSMLNNFDAYKLTADGIFGKGTKTAVEKFQKKMGIAVDGIAGKDTINKLEKMTASNIYGILTVKSESLNVRAEANFKSKVLKTIKKGEVYKVYGVKNGLYNLGASHYCSAGSEYVSFHKNSSFKN